MQVRYNTTVCSSCQGHEAEHVLLKQDDGGLDVGHVAEDMLAAAASAWAWVDPQ
jgi:hypothetical protein